MLEKTLANLIAFKTFSRDNQENRKALLWVQNQVQGLPLYIKKFNIKGFPALILATKKTFTPYLWLVGHMDVVPGDSSLFKARREGKKLYGRGAFDMKFAIACYIELLKDLGNTLSKYDIGVMITTDEELGGFYGVKALLDKGFHSKFCILPDGGEDWKYQQSAKGVWQLLITAKGKSAHSSRPWKGKNALEEIIGFIENLRKNFSKEPCGIKSHYHNTLNIGKIQGGQAANQIPDVAEALIDIRFTAQTSKTELKRVLDSARKGLPSIHLTDINFAPSYEVDINNNFFTSFDSIFKQMTKKKARYVDSHGSSDARFFIERGVPVILVRPVGGGHHGEREWIDLEELGKFYKGLSIFVKEYAKVKM